MKQGWQGLHYNVAPSTNSFWQICHAIEWINFTNDRSQFHLRIFTDDIINIMESGGLIHSCFIRFYNVILSVIGIDFRHINWPVTLFTLLWTLLMTAKMYLSHPIRIDGDNIKKPKKNIWTKNHSINSSYFWILQSLELIRLWFVRNLWTTFL